MAVGKSVNIYIMSTELIYSSQQSHEVGTITLPALLLSKLRHKRGHTASKPRRQIQTQAVWLQNSGSYHSTPLLLLQEASWNPQDKLGPLLIPVFTPSRALMTLL